jgi:hypothetical protein
LEMGRHWKPNRLKATPSTRRSIVEPPKPKPRRQKLIELPTQTQRRRKQPEKPRQPTPRRSRQMRIEPH